MILATNFDPFTFIVKSRTTEDKFDDVAVGLYTFYKIVPEDFYILYPDAKIPLGSYDVEDKRTSGPEVITKIERKIDTEKFWRVKIGVAGAAEEFTDVDLMKIQHVGEKIAYELDIVHKTQPNTY